MFGIENDRHRVPVSPGCLALFRDREHASGVVGTVFDIQRYALHDGPGVRTTVYFKGCPLACAWCHNPEGQLAARELIIHSERCRRCRACVPACTRGAARFRSDVPVIARNCTACGVCVDACLCGARRIVGAQMTAQAVMRQIDNDRILFDESGGGVTFSGGEPMLQPAFLHALLMLCKAHDYDTAVETCGFCQTDDLLVLAPLVDVFLYDIKHTDSARHQALAGQDNALILANLRALAASHRSVVVRFPVIPGVNDDDANVEALIGLMRQLKLMRVDLLPYHRIGTDKYERLGRSLALPTLRTPSRESLELLLRRFGSSGIDARC